MVSKAKKLYPSKEPEKISEYNKKYYLENRDRIARRKKSRWRKPEERSKLRMLRRETYRRKVRFIAKLPAHFSPYKLRRGDVPSLLMREFGVPFTALVKREKPGRWSLSHPDMRCGGVEVIKRKKRYELHLKENPGRARGRRQRASPRLFIDSGGSPFFL